jgi:solute carrier family 39 (zinc transporter), member 9
LIHAHPTDAPIPRIGFNLLSGFSIMLIIEQVLSHHPHSHSFTHDSLPLHNLPKPPETASVDFDAELTELERSQGSPGVGGSLRTGVPGPVALPDSAGLGPGEGSSSQGASGMLGGVSFSDKGLPLTLGLVLHALADGLALGVSFFPGSDSEGGGSLSIIVFLAILIHKGGY